MTAFGPFVVYNIPLLGGFRAHKRPPHSRQSSTGDARRPETLNSPAFMTALTAL